MSVFAAKKMMVDGGSTPERGVMTGDVQEKSPKELPNNRDDLTEAFSKLIETVCSCDL